MDWPVSVKIPDNNWKREHFIAYLVNYFHWLKGAELGVWRGRTFLYLLENCPQLTMIGIDLWAPQPRNKGPENYVHWNHEDHENYVREKSKIYRERAIIYKMWTTEASHLINTESLDFVFIDADHSSNAVKEDIEHWIPKLKPNGWIIGHDINWLSVRTVVDKTVHGYIIGPDNVWARPINPNANIFPFKLLSDQQ